MSHRVDLFEALGLEESDDARVVVLVPVFEGVVQLPTTNLKTDNSDVHLVPR